MPTFAETFAQGFETGFNQRRKVLGFRAAREQFGEAANDPGLFAALNNIQAAQNNQRRQDERLQFERNRENRAQQSFDISREQAENQNRVAGALRVVNGLRVARDRGEDMATAFDRFTPLLEDMGVNPNDFEAMKQSIVENPATLDDFAAALSDGRQIGGSTGARGGGQPPAVAQTETALLEFDKIFERLDFLQADENAAAGKAIFGFPSFRGVGQGGFGSLGSFPGSRAADFAQIVTGLEGSVSSQAFGTLKGAGAITENETKFASAAIASISRATSFEQFQRELDSLRRYVTALKGIAIRRAQGENIPDLSSSFRSSPAAPAQDGQQAAPGNLLDSSEFPVGTVVEGLGVFQGGDPADLGNWKPQ